MGERYAYISMDIANVYSGVSDSVDVIFPNYRSCSGDDKAYTFNCFRTREDAEAARKKIIKILRGGK